MSSEFSACLMSAVKQVMKDLADPDPRHALGRSIRLSGATAIREVRVAVLSPVPRSNFRPSERPSATASRKESASRNRQPIVVCAGSRRKDRWFRRRMHGRSCGFSRCRPRAERGQQGRRGPRDAQGHRLDRDAGLGQDRPGPRERFCKPRAVWLILRAVRILHDRESGRNGPGDGFQ